MSIQTWLGMQIVEHTEVASSGTMKRPFVSCRCSSPGSWLRVGLRIVTWQQRPTRGPWSFRRGFSDVIITRKLEKEPGSSGSTVSDYGLDDRAIGVRSPAGAKDFSSSLCVQTGSGAHPASCTMGTGVLSPGVKRGRGVTLTTHPHLVPRSWMSRSHTSSPPKRLHGV
jgi:hypothetical protein